MSREEGTSSNSSPGSQRKLTMDERLLLGRIVVWLLAVGVGIVCAINNWRVLLGSEPWMSDEAWPRVLWTAFGVWIASEGLLRRRLWQGSAAAHEPPLDARNGEQRSAESK